MVLLGDVGHVESYVMWIMSNLVSFRLERVLLSVRDWCTVCTEYTIGLEFVLHTTDGTPR